MHIIEMTAGSIDAVSHYESGGDLRQGDFCHKCQVVSIVSIMVDMIDGALIEK